MATVVGGLRARYIRESLFRMIEASLMDLGWWDSSHDLTIPLKWEAGPRNQDQQIEQNTATLSDENTTGDEIELGSQLSENVWTMYIDFFADSDALGLHFIRDMQDILRGRFTAIGRNDTVFPVFDYSQATPPIIFYCDIQNVFVDRAHGFLKPWLEHWYSCSFEVIDTYDSDDG